MKYLIALLIFLFPLSVLATPSLNGSASTTFQFGGGATTSTTLAFTVASSVPNGLLLVTYGAAAGSFATSATWNGTAMTQGTNGAGTNFRVSFFYLTNPEAGTYNVVVTHPSSAYHNIGIQMIQDAEQTTPINVFGSAAGDDSPTKTVTTTVDNTLVFGVFVRGNVAISSLGTGQTQAWESGDNYYKQEASYKTQATAGNVTMSATLADVGFGWDESVFAIAPGAAVVATPYQDSGYQFEEEY